MSFTTKKYTRPVLLAEVKKVRANYFTDLATFVNVFSPRAGHKSAKVAALRNALAMPISSVLYSVNGLKNKQAIIKQLKNS